MFTIAQDKFDELCDSLSAMAYQCGDWFPSLKEIKTTLEPNIDRDIKFALWILETSNPPKTQEAKDARKYLMTLVYNHLNIID